MAKEVTIVYTIEDEAAFQLAGNPLRFQHCGLKAHTIAVGDAVASRTELLDTVREIAFLGNDSLESQQARAALEKEEKRTRAALA